MLWLIILAVLGLLAALQYLLYINGFLVIRSITALVFQAFGPQWKTRPWARVRSCTGYARKVLKFEQSREYQFSFRPKVSRGSITVEVQNRDKKPILILDEENPRGVLQVKKSERYYLVVRFHKATGEFEMNWE